MNEIKRFRDGSYDYFSILPESVVLHILSFLPFKDIARTSVLSKIWKHIWINCPNIDLLIHDYRFASSIVPHVYLGHAGQALCQCLNRKACIQRFRLYISAKSTIKDASVLKYLDSAVDIIFSALFEKNVSELAVEMHFAQAVRFSIPEKVVVAHCLKVLEVVGCNLEERVACIDLPNLQKLKIHKC
ncbi:unnamed protein product [Cuscuta campestris]|uniref:F-box domain-containing protein n=1 Tax=Cuscuta campestris TaxID=132261 RepID=A0A484NN28_9ASTE|nr:unnamed protein product [Cuscuta campestris]